MVTPFNISSLKVSDNFIHIIHDSTSAIVVDPSEAPPVLLFIKDNNLTLRHIFITHHHADHTGGCAELKRETNCRILGPDDARIKLLDTCETSGITPEPQIIRTPGHTSSHICFYFPDLQALFSGDTLFLGGCGRLFEGNPIQMWQSLLSLRRLPANTAIYPGHDYTLDNLEFCRSVLPANQDIAERISAIDPSAHPCHSALALEMKTNVFLMCDDPEFTRLTGIRGFPADIFAELRSRKDSW